MSRIGAFAIAIMASCCLFHINHPLSKYCGNPYTLSIAGEFQFRTSGHKIFIKLFYDLDIFTPYDQ